MISRKYVCFRNAIDSSSIADGFTDAIGRAAVDDFAARSVENGEAVGWS